MLAGTAAPMACTVLPLLLTAHSWQRRPSSQRWLPLSSVMELPAPEVAVPMLAGTAAPMACTVLPLLLTAHSWQRRPSSQRWLPLSSVMELPAPEVAVPMLAATAADCPFVAKKTQLSKMAAPKQCDGTPCPGGCCPNVGWYCCPDGMYCAATAADCPFVSK